MSILFVARIFDLPQIEYVLGIVVMMLGFALGYLPIFLNVSI
jgi:hypothetical protein